MALTAAGRRWLDDQRVADPDPRQLELPWGGRSPRALTKAAQAFRLSLEAATLDEDAMIDQQYQRFLHGC